MNAWRVPYEAHLSVVGYASEGSALRSMWRSDGLQPVGAPPARRTCLREVPPCGTKAGKTLAGPEPNRVQGRRVKPPSMIRIDDVVLGLLVFILVIFLYLRLGLHLGVVIPGRL